MNLWLAPWKPQRLTPASYQESGTAEIEGTPLHTLREKGNLDKYEGAHVDDLYRREADGSKKWQALVEEFREN